MAEGPRIIDERTILYRSGRHVYVNTLESACPSLDWDKVLIVEIHGSQICRNVRNSRIRNRKQDNSDLRQLAGTEFTQPDRLSTADEFYRAPRRRQPPGSDIPYRHARVAQQFSERLA